jgi:hypothetical protein
MRGVLMGGVMGVSRDAVRGAVRGGDVAGWNVISPPRMTFMGKKI